MTITSTKVQIYLTTLRWSAKVLTEFYLRIALKSKKISFQQWNLIIFYVHKPDQKYIMMVHKIGIYIIYIIENKYSQKNIVFTFYSVFKKYAVSILNVE